MLSAFKRFRNAEALREAEVPRVTRDVLAGTVVEVCRRGGRLALWFVRRTEAGVRVYAVVAEDASGLLGVLAAEAPEGARYRSMTPSIPQANRPERELFEQMGLRPEGHPWLKSIRHPVPKPEPPRDRVLGEPSPETIPGNWKAPRCTRSASARSTRGSSGRATSASSARAR